MRIALCFSILLYTATSLVGQEEASTRVSSLTGDAQRTFRHQEMSLALTRVKVSLADAIAVFTGVEKGAVIEQLELVLLGSGAKWSGHALTPLGRIGFRVDAVTAEIKKDEPKKLKRSRADLRTQIEEAKFRTADVLANINEQGFGSSMYRLDIESHDEQLRYRVDIAEPSQIRRIDFDASGKMKTKLFLISGRCFLFETTPIGERPADWRFAFTGTDGKAAWSVAGAKNSPLDGHVLAMKDIESPNGTYNLGFAPQKPLADVDVRVFMRAISGELDQGGGVFWRAKDEANYYVCRFNPLEKNFRVYRVIQGERTQLGSAEWEAKPGSWTEIRAVMIGRKITCTIDGQPLLVVEDAELPEAGSVGVWTKADAASEFDDFTVLPATEQPTSDDGESKK